jgi:hypothetical protein
MIKIIDFLRSCPNFPILSSQERSELQDLLRENKPALFSHHQDVLLALVVCFQDLLDSTEPIRIKDIQFILKSIKSALMYSLDEFSSFGLFAPAKEINISALQSRFDFLFLHLFQEPKATFLTPILNEHVIPFICILAVNFNLKHQIPFPDLLRGCINGIRFVKGLPTICKKISYFISSSLLNAENSLQILMQIFHQPLEADFPLASQKIIKILTAFPSFLTKEEYIQKMIPKLKAVLFSNTSSNAVKQISAQICLYFASIEPLIVIPTSAHSWLFSKEQPQLEEFFNQIIFVYSLVSHNQPECLANITESNSFLVCLIYLTHCLWTSLCEIVTIAKDLIKIALETLPEEHLKFCIVQGFLICSGIEECKYSFESAVGSDSQIALEPRGKVQEFSLVIDRFNSLLLEKNSNLFCHIFLELSSRKEGNEEKIKQILLALVPLIEQSIGTNREQSLIFIQSFLEIFIHSENSDEEEFLTTIYSVLPSIIFNPEHQQEFSANEVRSLNRIYELLNEKESQKDLRSMIEETLKNQIEIPKAPFTASPLEEIYFQISDSSIPTKAEGLVSLKRYIQTKDNSFDSETVQEIYSKLLEALKETDSFVYLRAIKCMEALAYSYHSQIIPLLVCNLNSYSSSKSIEVFAKIIESFGSFFSKYADLFIEKALSILHAKETEDLLKAEILSLISLIFEHNPYALCAQANQLMIYCLYLLEKTSADLEAKKGSLIVLKHLIAAAGKDVFRLADCKFIERAVQVLQIYSQNADSTLKMHANEALYHLDRHLLRLDN